MCNSLNRMTAVCLTISLPKNKANLIKSYIYSKSDEKLFGMKENGIAHNGTDTAVEFSTAVFY